MNNNSQEVKCTGTLCMAIRKGDFLEVRRLIKTCNYRSCEQGYLSPLWESVILGNVQITELLLKEGCNVNDPHAYHGADYTPIKEMAFHRGRTDMVRLLVAYGADVNAAGEYPTPLYLAVENGNPELVAHLLFNGARLEDPATTVSLAVTSDRAMELLGVLQKHTRLDHQDDKGNNAFHWLSSTDQDRTIEVGEMLLRFGVPLDQPGYMDYTPLLQAVWMNRISLVSWFLMRGANVHQRTHPSAGGQTALHLACMYHRDNMIRILLAHGADANAVDHCGATPFSLMRLEILPAVRTMTEHLAKLKLENSFVTEKNMALVNVHSNVNKIYEEYIRKIEKSKRTKFCLYLSFFLFSIFCIIFFGCFVLDSVFETKCDFLMHYIFQAYASISTYLKNTYSSASDFITEQDYF